jgi:hypothetical protein
LAAELLREPIRGQLKTIGSQDLYFSKIFTCTFELYEYPFDIFEVNAMLSHVQIQDYTILL